MINRRKTVASLPLGGRCGRLEVRRTEGVEGSFSDAGSRRPTIALSWRHLDSRRPLGQAR
jgi:hypothetical protein